MDDKTKNRLRALSFEARKSNAILTEVTCTCGDCLCGFPLIRPNEIRRGRCSECQSGRHGRALTIVPGEC